MDKLPLAYTMYRDPSCTLTLDELLAHLKITHLVFRQHLHDNDKPLPYVTPALTEEIISHEWPAKKICNHYHISKDELWQVLQDNPRRGLSGQQKMDMCKMRANGVSVYGIAQDFDVTESRVYQITACVPTARKKRRVLSDQDIVEMARKHHHGQPVTTLAKVYNVSLNTAYKAIRDAGVIIA